MSKKRILIADDDEEIYRAIIRHILRNFDDKLEPLVCKDGDEALNMIKKEDVSIAVLDIRMPNLDGVEVCRRLIASDNIDSPEIIITSGFIDADNKKELESLNIKWFLHKPYQMTKLFETISLLLK